MVYMNGYLRKVSGNALKYAYASTKLIGPVTYVSFSGKAKLPQNNLQ